MMINEKYPLPARNEPDVWECISSSNKPVAIYGTGNGADKIMDELENRGIRAAAVFASDGFLRGQTFRGYSVISYDEACRRLGDFTVLLAFGTSRPDVISNILRIASERTLLCPDTPAFGSVFFDSAYYRENYDAFAKLYSSLEDDESRRVLSEILRYKLSGELSPLLDSASPDPSDGILEPELYETIADLGSYTGDTVRCAVEKMARLRVVYALEPEPHAYKKLCAYADTVTTPTILTYNAAAWSHETQLKFVSGAGRGSSEAAKMHRKTRELTVQALPLDNIVDRHVDFIKFDVEGAEAEALEGARGTICRDRPDLLVSVYHKTEDLTTLPSLVRELVPEYRLFLRREYCIPAWGINLYAKVRR